MRAPTDPFTIAPKPAAGRPAQARRISAPAPVDPPVYDLRTGGNSDQFYADAARFSDRLLVKTELRAAVALDGYIRYVQRELSEEPRSRGEYALEFLTLGMALCRYACAAAKTSPWAVEMAQRLFRLRNQSWPAKPLADGARAILTRLFLLPGISRESNGASASLDELPRLLDWLRATGEFEHIAARIDNWRKFLITLPRMEAEKWIGVSTALFAWFEREAADALGRYTSGVDRFLNGEYARRSCREDQLFCSKPAVEYHLGMVAAEIMNRGLRADFARKPKKVVLVPACMRGAKVGSCRAHTRGTDTICTACDPGCAVNRVTRKMRSLGAKVYLVPHSTGFSRWLTRWQEEPDTGVAAAACMLNILPGGYEMRARGISSQCVPLDYPGCAKHWSRRGIATALNEQRLVQIVTGPQLQPT